MEAARNTPASNCHILTNSPALHSLKRQQLVQLCKRNGIKATGKNSEIVGKLKAHALNHPSPLASRSFFSSDDEDNKENGRGAMPRPSEAWTVIEEDSREVERVHLGLKDIREEVEQEMCQMSPLKGFGTSISGEFGNRTTSSKGSSMTSSLKAFATSLKRGSGSKTSTEPVPSIKFTTHAEEPTNDTLALTSTPYHAHPQTYPSLPSPEPLDADDSRDQSLIDLGASTIRLVTSAPTGPSPPTLRPFTPSFEPSYSPGSPVIPPLYSSLLVEEDADPLPPSAFSSASSGPPKPSSPPPQPFIFGSPVHRISNTDFNSAAASVLAEMNARLGLTGTSGEVGLDILQKRDTPAQDMASPVRQERFRTEVTNKFDRAHERQFEKMEGLGEWHARRNAASPGKPELQDVAETRKRKSEMLGGPYRRPIVTSNARARRTSRVMTSGTRRSLAANAEIEETEERKAKRVRISIVEGGDLRPQIPDAGSQVEDVDMEESGKTILEREQERAAIKKKLEISRARRRSSMGRVSVGGGRPPLIPNQPKKGTATRFGFLSSAKSLVKSVWNKGVGTTTQATKPVSIISNTKPSQIASAPSAKKSTPNVLMKPNSNAKPMVPKFAPARISAVTSEPKTSLRVPPTGFGLNRKSSVRSGTNSTTGTRSSTASFAATRSSTVSSAASGIPAARRGPIPSFQQPSNHISRTSSLASAAGPLRSITSSSGTGSSRGTASSIGVRKPQLQSSALPSDAGNGSINSIVRNRKSTLLAPTASSLARMQSTVRPPPGAASNPIVIGAEAKGLGRVPEQCSPTHSGIPSFTFTSPAPVGGVSTPGKGVGSIFSGGTPTFSPSLAPPSTTAVQQPRQIPPRRPRISRSRVIAKVGAQRAASGSSLNRSASGRRSLNAPKTRGSLGARVSGIGAKCAARDAAAMSARKRLRQSEILRRRSKISGVSPALAEREETPESRLDDDEILADRSVDISMDV